MKTILQNQGNKDAFKTCVRKNKRTRKVRTVLRSSFSVYDYAKPEETIGNFGPAFYIGRTESHLPLPGEKRAKVRIRVYPK